MSGVCAGVTLNRNLFETALRHLLVDSADYMVQLFEGSGSHWKKTRCVQLYIKRSTARHNELMMHARSRLAPPLHWSFRLAVGGVDSNGITSPCHDSGCAEVISLGSLKPRVASADIDAAPQGGVTREAGCF